MTRRDFLAGVLAAPLGGVIQGRRRRRRPRRAVGPAKLARVGISTRSFRHFESTADGVVPPDQRLVLLDFPALVADRYKVHNLEFVAPHFASLEPTYLQELKSNLVRAHSRLINIPVDVPEIQEGGGLSDPDPSIRQRAIDAGKKWIDIAKQMSARSVRCDPGKIDLESLAPTAESYRELAAYGRLKRIDVLVENHGPIGSAHPEMLVKLFKTVGSAYFGALPDFGNFPDEARRQQGLPALFPFAKTVCHAKGIEFDAQGNETHFNFEKCVEISKRARFEGVYSIEYEGQGDDYDGVQNVVNELLRFL